jgi:L-arabinose isomerase
MKNAKIGLLPLYVKFYDDVLPELAKQVEPFITTVETGLTQSGLDVVTAPMSRTRPDFAAAVRQFESDGVNAIVTLHLAYSPSLESAEVLARTQLPIVMLGTTPDRDFGGHVDPVRLLENHGIHGLQDLASVLRRFGKPYQVVAGHLDDQDVIQRCVAAVRSATAGAVPIRATTSIAFSATGNAGSSKDSIQAGNGSFATMLPAPKNATALMENGGDSDRTHFLNLKKSTKAERAARSLRSTRVLRIGGVFPGMGDFAVCDKLLKKRLGIAVENIEPHDLSATINSINDKTVAAEVAADRKQFRVECDAKVHARSVHVGLGLREFLKRGEFGAFSLNFLAFKESTGLVCTVPFLECCKAMARGIGYAGEGDALTAALVGALLQGFGPTTFTEIFCPDWIGHSLFLSHMGEINPAEAAAQPLLYEKEFPFTPALNPATLACALRPGRATLVNLSPGPQDSFRLITASVEVLADGTHPDLDRWVRGWIRPALRLPRFLEEFSHLGGTHHSALLFGEHDDALADFSALLAIEHCNLS